MLPRCCMVSDWFSQPPPSVGAIKTTWPWLEGRLSGETSPRTTGLGTPMKTNILEGWKNINFLNRRYIFTNGWLFRIMLVFQGVTFGELHGKNPPNLKTTFFLGANRKPFSFQGWDLAVTPPPPQNKTCPLERGPFQRERIVFQLFLEVTWKFFGGVTLARHAIPKECRVPSRLKFNDLLKEPSRNF